MGFEHDGDVVGCDEAVACGPEGFLGFLDCEDPEERLSFRFVGLDILARAITKYYKSE